MADVFKLMGSYGTAPASGAPSADPRLDAVLEEGLSLSAKEFRTYRLVSDAPQAIDLGGLSGVHVAIVKAIGGSAVLRLSSAAGDDQDIPVDSLFFNISETTPITAMSVTREAGIEVTVKIFLGEKA